LAGILQDQLLLPSRLTISVDTTQQVLVQAHLIEGLEGLLPLGEESLALTALGSAHAAQRKQAQNMAGVWALQLLETTLAQAQTSACCTDETRYNMITKKSFKHGLRAAGPLAAHLTPAEPSTMAALLAISEALKGAHYSFIFSS
jgi:hypothetical protein